MTTRTIRLFIEADLAPGATVALGQAQVHQLRHVLRCRAGDQVRLFNARDGEWQATLVLDRRETTARVDERLRPQAPEPGPLLAFAPLKRSRLELLVEKACEVGASALQPVATAHAVVDRLNRERLGTILREAAEQSERLTVPELRPIVPLADWLASPTRPQLYAALERADAPPLDAAIAEHGAGDLLGGPEGGFSADERRRLQVTPSVIPVSLGPRILRAETAALGGIFLLASRMCR